jgi:23S rRNA pseudouridine955/2504/2580 synthase
VPPAEAVPERSARPQRELDPLTDDERDYVRDMVINTTPDAIVLNKPPGLATQGGTKTDKHLDRLLSGLR